MAYLIGALTATLQPPGISAPGDGGKFTPDGTVLPWPGNTIICHIDPASPAHRELVALQDALRAGPHAHRFTFLPPASFHMTMFQCLSGPRASEGDWPDGVPKTASRDNVTGILADRLRSVRIPTRHRIRPLEVLAGFSLAVAGADAAEEASLRRTRETLRDATGIRSEGFETYGFHITLAYLLAWLDPGAARAVAALSETLTARFLAAVPEIVLGPLELCNFETMHRFDPVVIVDGHAT